MFKALFPALPGTTRLFQADGAGGAGAGAAADGAAPAVSAAAASAPADGGAGAAAAAAPAAKWFEASDYSADDRAWLAARGLAEDDPLKAVPKLVHGHRAAEQRIGKGLDTIMDRPAKDQALSAWMRSNGAILGLPDKEEGYTAAPPEDWPKDTAWDTELEAKARKLAFDAGVPLEAHQAYVALFADKMKQMTNAAVVGMAKARGEMMAALEHDYGAQTDARITAARQAAQLLAEKAGMSTDQLGGISQVLAAKTGDAGVIRLFAAMADMMGEDTAVGIGKGGPLTMTPAEARAELARLMAPEGEYAKAYAAQDTAALAALKPRREQLAKIATGTL